MGDWPCAEIGRQNEWQVSSMIMFLYSYGRDVGVKNECLHCKNSPWMILLTNPTTLENYDFNVFLNVLNVEGCIHSLKCMSFTGSLPQSREPSSTSPTLTWICCSHHSLAWVSVTQRASHQSLLFHRAPRRWKWNPEMAAIRRQQLAW